MKACFPQKLYPFKAAFVGPLVLALTAIAQAPAPFPAPDLPTPTAPSPATATTTGLRPPATAAPARRERLKFRDAPVDMLMQEYAEKTGRVLLLAPNLPKASVTLESDEELSLEDRLQAMDLVLGMNGIALLKVGERFLQAVPIAQARQEPMEILADGISGPLPEDGRLVSQLINLKHIDVNEARKAVEPLKHPYGQIHAMESINALLITETSATLNRMAQLLGYIDQPVEAREEPFFVFIKHTKASEIKKRVEELIAEYLQQKEAPRSTVPQPTRTGAPGVVTPPAIPAPPGVIRAAPVPKLPEPEPTPELMEAAERGVIRGKVKIVADDRTNYLIIITRPENMKFFEKVITVLDVETAPDVIVKVIRLEYAEAKTIAGMLNELIGATSAKDEVKAAPKPGTEAEERVRALREMLQPPSPTSAAEAERKSKVGELSKENIKILSDERTNALIIMATRSDMATLEEIIASMDIMLSQVLVEAVILSVNLENKLASGIDWLQRSLVAYRRRPDGSRRPVFAVAGAGGGGGLHQAPAETLVRPFLQTDKGQPAGLTYYTTFFDLNLNMVLNLVASDDRSRVLASPVILTTDNKAAVIDASNEEYFYKGKKYVGAEGGSPIYEDDVERKRVGIVLKVTPRINKSKDVVMEIEQTIEEADKTQTIGGQPWPVVTSRKLQATVAVRSGQTIVLGGLVKTREKMSKSKIPFLGDIPLLGMLFRAKSTNPLREEVMVFITPYVLDTPEEIASESRRRKEVLNAQGLWTRDWSGSHLAEEAPSTNLPPARPLMNRLFRSREESRSSGATDSQDQRSASPRSSSSTEAVTAPSASPDPWAGTDPEWRRFVEEQDRRWESALRRLDERTKKQDR